MVDILINLQRANCRVDKLLSEKDLKRIFNRTGGIINTTNECILWKGYITHNKIDYIRKKLSMKSNNNQEYKPKKGFGKK